MLYYDEGGPWDITISARDKGNQTWQYNKSVSFDYGIIESVNLSIGNIIWPETSFGQQNTTPTDYVIIDNTGNYNGTVYLNATDLMGEIDTNYRIGADNFTAYWNNGTGNQQCIGNQLSNGISTPITLSNSNPGDLSIGDGSGQSELHYCIPNFPFVLSQTYSTAVGNPWEIRFDD